MIVRRQTSLRYSILRCPTIILWILDHLPIPDDEYGYMKNFFHYIYYLLNLNLFFHARSIFWRIESCIATQCVLFTYWLIKYIEINKNAKNFEIKILVNSIFFSRKCLVYTTRIIPRCLTLNLGIAISSLIIKYLNNVKKIMGKNNFRNKCCIEKTFLVKAIFLLFKFSKLKKWKYFSKMRVKKTMVK